MANFYFTFGSDPQFPYGRDDYVLVQCDDMGEAYKLFKAIHPNRPLTNTINCAFIYNEQQWQTGVRKYYEGQAPVETIAIKRVKRREIPDPIYKITLDRAGSQ